MAQPSDKIRRKIMGIDTNAVLDGVMDTNNQLLTLQDLMRRHVAPDRETKKLMDEAQKNQAVELLAELINTLKVKGTDGYTPQKGIDYFTNEEIAMFLLYATPVKGRDYYTPEEATNFIEYIRTSVRSQVKDGEKGEPGEKGKDGTEIAPAQIREKLESLKGEERLDATAIKNLPKYLEKKAREQKWGRWGGIGIETIQDDGTTVSTTARTINFGTGLSVTANGSTVVITGTSTTNFTDSEIVSGSGTTWTLAATPVAGSVHLYARGQRLTPGVGNDYTISGDTITTTNSWSAGDLLADYRT